MNRATTQPAEAQEDRTEAWLNGPCGFEVVRNALREEFQVLQGKLLEAVRSELVEASGARPPVSLPLTRGRRSPTSHSDLSLGTPDHKYMPMKAYKMTEYKRWLEELDDVFIDQGLPSPRDRDQEERRSPRAAPARPVANDSKRTDPPDQVDVLKRAAMCDAPTEKPMAPMASHPCVPQQAEEETADSMSQTSTRKTKGSAYPSQGTVMSAAPTHVSSAKSHQLYAKHSPIHKVERLVRSARFEMLSMAMIFCSALHIGWQTDYMARHMLLTPPVVFRVFDIAFLVFFIFELLLRLVVYRLRYFYMWGWQWNVLDLVLILMQVVEEAVQVADPNAKTGFSSQLLRIVRILRAVRVIRIVHAMKFAEELRLLVNCVMHSSRSFHWAGALILLMVYVMGVHLTQVALVESAEDVHAKDQLQTWYGSVPRAMLSLFQGLTGGVDWNDLSEPLVSISPWFGLTFVIYMAFASIAVMNVVAGTFVQQAIERAEHMNEVRKVSQASYLFRTLDEHREGFITFEEIQGHMETAAVRDFFQSIDLDVSEARCLFDMLDADNSGKIDFEEFLGGCMRLQGPAKAIDLVMFMREMKDDLRRLIPA